MYIYIYIHICIHTVCMHSWGVVLDCIDRAGPCDQVFGATTTKLRHLSYNGLDSIGRILNEVTVSKAAKTKVNTVIIMADAMVEWKETFESMYNTTESSAFKGSGARAGYRLLEFAPQICVAAVADWEVRLSDGPVKEFVWPLRGSVSINASVTAPPAGVVCTWDGPPGAGSQRRDYPAWKVSPAALCVAGASSINAPVKGAGGRGQIEALGYNGWIKRGFPSYFPDFLRIGGTFMKRLFNGGVDVYDPAAGFYQPLNKLWRGLKDTFLLPPRHVANIAAGKDAACRDVQRCKPDTECPDAVEFSTGLPGWGTALSARPALQAFNQAHPDHTESCNLWMLLERVMQDTGADLADRSRRTLSQADYNMAVAGFSKQHRDLLHAEAPEDLTSDLDTFIMLLRGSMATPEHAAFTEVTGTTFSSSTLTRVCPGVFAACCFLFGSRQALSTLSHQPPHEGERNGIPRGYHTSSVAHDAIIGTMVIKLFKGKPSAGMVMAYRPTTESSPESVFVVFNNSTRLEMSISDFDVCARCYKEPSIVTDPKIAAACTKTAASTRIGSALRKVASKLWTQWVIDQEEDRMEVSETLYNCESKLVQLVGGVEQARAFAGGATHDAGLAESVSSLLERMDEARREQDVLDGLLRLHKHLHHGQTQDDHGAVNHVVEADLLRADQPEVRTHTHKHTHTHTHTPAHTHTLSLSLSHSHAHTHTHIRTFIRPYLHIYICVYGHTHTHVRASISTQTYILVYRHKQV
jgi:hypothetical protein